MKEIGTKHKEIPIHLIEEVGKKECAVYPFVSPTSTDRKLFN